MNKLLVIGLDGADWGIILPWVRDGHLPNLKSLLSAGCSGPLASTVPPITFPAWSSFMTGLNPGRHGVLDFCEKVKGEFRLHFYNSSDIQGDPYWRLLSRENQKVGLVGIPVNLSPGAGERGDYSGV
jgi:predicted AlkP superfamily phosphohydrolase/phosphomutase